MPTYLHAIVIGSILLQAPFLEQAAAQVPARARAFQQLAEPPVPSDPLELVTGDAPPVQDISQRAEIINLLINAHRYSNVRAQPYDLKTTFTVSGSLSGGTWQEEDMSPGAGRYRWSVQGPGFSAVNMNLNRIFYSDQQATGLPLRLIQFREAIFYTPASGGTSRDASNGYWHTERCQFNVRFGCSRCHGSSRDRRTPVGRGRVLRRSERGHADHVLAGARLVCTLRLFERAAVSRQTDRKRLHDHRSGPNDYRSANGKPGGIQSIIQRRFRPPA